MRMPTIHVILTVLLGTVLAGCGSGTRIIYQPRPVHLAEGVKSVAHDPVGPAGRQAALEYPSARLVADASADPKAIPTPATSAASAAAADRSTTRPVTRVGDRATTTQPAQRFQYTLPSPGMRTLNLLAGPVALAVIEGPGSGRERGESFLAAPGGGRAGLAAPVLGRGGLTAPQNVAVSAVVGRPGLIQGAATGLSFASRVNNIFTPRVNRLTGPGGRCGDLVSAGFFPGTSACQQRFRR